MKSIEIPAKKRGEYKLTLTEFSRDLFVLGDEVDEIEISKNQIKPLIKALEALEKGLK